MTNVLVEIDDVPYGWTNEQRHNGHEQTLNTVGNQSSMWTHLKTHSRVDVPTECDGDGNILNKNITISQFILAGQITLADRDAIIYALAVGILGPNPSEGNLLAVANKAKITEKTDKELRDMLRDKAAAWGEI